MTRVLTGKRMEMRRHLRRHPAPSVLALARSLGRDYRRVHDDVEALAGAGLIEKDDRGVRTEFDVLHTDIIL